MRIGYFGSPAISATLLAALVDSGEHEVAFVVSNPDRPRGRSGQASATPCSSLALEHRLPLFRYARLQADSGNDPATELARFGCDLFVVFAYGRILPRSIFAMPSLGTVNLHASLLPELRGASPIQSAILRGFTQTGWTLQQMEAELDCGDIIATTKVAILPNETAGELTDRMLLPGVQLVLRTLSVFPDAVRHRTPQAPELVTFCSKFTTDMANLDWHVDAGTLHNKVRALNPWPMARSHLDGRLVRILATQTVAEAENHLPGAGPAELLALKVDGQRRLFAGTGTGLLEILALQMENRRAMNASDFLNGVTVAAGARFSGPPGSAGTAGSADNTPKPVSSQAGEQ